LTSLQDGLAEIKSLAHVINTSIAAIEQALTDSSTVYPSPSTVPFTPQSEGGRNLPSVQLAGASIVGAAAQLIAVVRPPLTMLTNALQASSADSGRGLKLIQKQFNISTALRIAIVTHTAEILRTAGPQVIIHHTPAV
jgi:hypothetical protein